MSLESSDVALVKYARDLLDDVLGGRVLENSDDEVMAEIEAILEEIAPPRAIDPRPYDRHIVKAGESLWSIAVEYEVEWSELLAWNDLTESSFVWPGQALRIQPVDMTDEVMSLDTQEGWGSPVDRYFPGAYPASEWMEAISHGQQYTYPEAYVGQWHTGCDLNRIDRRDYGAPFYAAAAGTVASIAKVNNESDIWIVLAHARGVDTRYGHAKDHAVRLGEEVQRGQLLGWIGDAGGLYDPHLHFDMAKKELLRAFPGHWVGHNYGELGHYIDPIATINAEGWWQDFGG